MLLKTIHKKELERKWTLTSSFPLPCLKVPWCSFQNVPICLLSFKNNALEISHSLSTKFSSNLSLIFVKESSLFIDIFYCCYILCVCKQTFCFSKMCISQKLKKILLWNLQHIFYVKVTTTYRQIWKSLLVYI